MLPAQINLAIIGMGYVGLPLAVEFGKVRKVIGFDKDIDRIEQLKRNVDKTNEIDPTEIAEARFLKFESDPSALKHANCYIVAVPTPITKSKHPDFTPLTLACRTIANHLSLGDVVIFESTVYPGATEEICVPILEEISGLKYNETFFCGYSPERINPGDRTRGIRDIVKVTSGSTPEAARFVDTLYREIIMAGTHMAPSMAVAEAAKVIENTQRDLNIALVNELAIIFHKLGIDTGDVLAAASTKWNFAPFTPGLVGGHCIGVDPYYLTFKAQSAGYNPEVILAGRRLNDSMPVYVAGQFVKGLLAKSINPRGANILVLGVTFKENCSDIRNSKVFDMISELSSYGCDVKAYDPWVIKSDLGEPTDINLIDAIDKAKLYDGLILAVAHNNFRALNISDLQGLCNENHLIYDLKRILNRTHMGMRL